MQSKRRQTDSTDPTPWIRANAGIEDYSLGFTAYPDLTAAGNMYTIQFTHSNPETFQRITFTRVGVILTITYEGIGHTLSVGDAISLRGTPFDLPGADTFQVLTTPSVSTLTVAIAIAAGPLTGSGESSTLSVDDLAGFVGVSGKNSGEIAPAVQMVRLIPTGPPGAGFLFIQLTQSNY